MKNGLHTMSKKDLREKLAADIAANKDKIERHASPESPQLARLKYGSTKRKKLQPHDARQTEYENWLQTQL